VAQVHRLRAEVVTEIRHILGLVSESRIKTEEAGKLTDDFEVQRTQVNGSTALWRVKRPLISCCMRPCVTAIAATPLPLARAR